METSQNNTVWEFVSAGRALSFVFEDYIPLHPNLIGIPIEDGQKTQEINLMWVRDQYLLSSMNKMISFVKKNTW